MTKTRAERGKCVLPKDNLNVKSVEVFANKGMLDAKMARGVINQVAYDAWQIAHDQFCDMGKDCGLTTHANPMNEEG